ncbi:amidohydrolase family protein [Dactylosporangium sp. NPDC005572]|uniref:amidohydrolase family protein n=1 Tax=Dactylosporangium sp. NPDC005572 TaxID=3156889 RepID=UPI0033B8ECB8
MSLLADAHVHFFATGYPGDGRSPVPGAGQEVAAYERIRTSAAVSDVLVVGFEGAAFATGNNDYIRTLAIERDWMHTTAYVAAGGRPSAAMARAVFAAGHIGISIYAADILAGRMIRDWPTEFWAECDRSGAVVSINAVPEAVEQLTGLPSMAPNCAFLFAHLGLPGRYAFAPTAEVARTRLEPLLRLAEHPNCFVKISGLYAVSDPRTAYPHDAATPFVTACLRDFGAGRCLWGSDFAPALEYISFEQCRDLRQLGSLAAADRQLVMGDNLRRLVATRRR